MFKKRKKNDIESFEVNEVEEEESLKSELEPYSRTLKDIFAPHSLSINEDYITLNNKYIKNYIMQSYPQTVRIGWLDAIYSYNGNMDTSIYVEPADDRSAQYELTKKITQYKAQLQIELEKGSVQHITELQDKIDQLVEDRRKIEQNRESIYHVAISSNLICDSEDELKRESQFLERKLGGKRMSFIPTYLRMDDGFKTALPMGNVYIKDKLRNLNTGALGACFPFYNSEISHPDGVFIGINGATGTPMYIDFYDKKMLANTNISVFGKAGSGKSFFVSLLTMRSALKGVRTVIIDPEKEYHTLTEKLGGVYLDISVNSKSMINPFDIEDCDELDKNDKPTGRRIVYINDKISDILNLISVMVKSTDTETLSLLSGIAQNLYKNFGIDSNPESLYYLDDCYHEGIFYPAGKKKRMPILTDYYNEVLSYIKEHPEDSTILRPITNSLKMFLKSGIYGLFDCQSTVDSEIMNNAPIITFDVNGLEENILRPVGMYVALTWAWEKFGKKNRNIRKRIVCDEAWMLVKKTMPGYQYTAKFLENTARRIRKRNGGLLVASQNFIEFARTDEGMAVLSQIAVKIFLRQDVTDIDSLQKAYHLSMGERRYLLSLSVGQMLIKTESDASTVFVQPFPYETAIINGRA